MRVEVDEHEGWKGHIHMTRPAHYIKGADGVIRRRTPKLRGKSAVKAAKKNRQGAELGYRLNKAA